MLDAMLVGVSYSPSKLADTLELNVPNVTTVLAKLVTDGRLTRVGRGEYQKPAHLR